MAEEKLLVEFETEHGSVKLSPNIIRRYLVNGQGAVTDEEVVMFINLCRYQQLNPFLKEAYLIKYSNSQPATMVVGKDTFLKRAEKHPKYDGNRAGVYVQRDKSIEKRVGTLILPGEKLVGGWAEVFRRDWNHPVEISVSYQEYEGKTKNGDTTRQWARMPATMIRKIALVQALREAFPDNFQGMYDAAEMSVSENGSVDYQVYPEREEFGTAPPQPPAQDEEPPKEKSEEYRKLEEQILKDLDDPKFIGMVEIDGHEADLLYYKREIPFKLGGKVVSIDKLRQTADTVARMLQAAYYRDKKEKELETLDDEGLFEAKPENEGNLQK